MDLLDIKLLLAEKLGDDCVIADAEMSSYCSFRCGGRADLLVTAEDMDALRYILYVTAGAEVIFGGFAGCKNATFCSSGHCCEKRMCASCEKEKQHGRNKESFESLSPEKHGICSLCEKKKAKAMPEVMVLGNGSNILVQDGGYRGIIIKLGDGFTEVRRSGRYITAGAAASLSTVAKEAARCGLSGLAFANGIPASCGGAVFMNAGAYGSEMKEVVQSVKVISRDGLREYLADNSELEFSYRHSLFAESGDIITEVTFALTEEDSAVIEREMRLLSEKRSAKQPLQYPSAGSFFKRPDGHFAGALIEEAGLKGLSVGGAQISPLHAGFIVNTGGATASDVTALMCLVQNTVYDRSGIMLMPEVQIIGEALPDGEL